MRKFNFIYAHKKGTAFSRPICVKLTNIYQYYQCVYHLYRILPKSDNKCGKYGRTLIYTHNQSLALTALIFMKLESLSERLWTSSTQLFIQIGAKRSKNGQKSTALTVSDFTKLKQNQRYYMDICTPNFNTKRSINVESGNSFMQSMTHWDNFHETHAGSRTLCK